MRNLQLQELTIEEQVYIGGGSDGDFAKWYGKYLGGSVRSFLSNPFGGVTNAAIKGFINAF